VQLALQRRYFRLNLLNIFGLATCNRLVESYTLLQVVHILCQTVDLEVFSVQRCLQLYQLVSRGQLALCGMLQSLVVLRNSFF
jgi:hypothetical protein